MYAVCLEKEVDKMEGRLSSIDCTLARRPPRPSAVEAMIEHALYDKAGGDSATRRTAREGHVQDYHTGVLGASKSCLAS